MDVKHNGNLTISISVAQAFKEKKEKQVTEKHNIPKEVAAQWNKEATACHI